MGRKIAAPAEDSERYIGKVKNGVSGKIEVNGRNNVAMFLGTYPNEEDDIDVITNEGTITLNGNNNTGLSTGVGGMATNKNASITRATNKGKIEVNGKLNTAMIAASSSGLNEVINLKDGEIILKGKKNVGLYSTYVHGEDEDNSQYRKFYRYRYFI